MANELFGDLEVKYKLIDDLAPFSHNARSHSKRQIRQIAASIETFGFTNPVLVDRTDTIIAGHGRLAAAKLLRMERVPTICLDGLSEDKVRAYILADNRIAEKAGWDKNILTIELQHLLSVELDFDIEVTGFEISEVDSILRKKKNNQHKWDAAKVDEAHEPVSKFGDIWALGKHRILSGSLEIGSLEDLMSNHRAILVIFVDPHQVDIAIRQWQQHTRDHAIHWSGKRFNDIAAANEQEHDT